MKEYILCAAIHIPDNIKHSEQPINIESGFIIIGRRHSDCYVVLKNLIPNYKEYLKSIYGFDEDLRKYQGFITSLNRYVNRKEAWKIAIDNNQIQYGLKASDNGENSELISENLYMDINDNM